MVIARHCRLCYTYGNTQQMVTHRRDKENTMICQRPWATTTHNGRAWSCLLRLGTVLLLGGCATYQPMPLTQQAVDRALAPPDMATLAATVTTLHNPLLQPVPVDLARGLTPDAAAILAVVGNPALRGERDRRAL